MSRRGLPAGVQRKHSRRCPAYRDKTARCRGKGCSYQAQRGPRGNRQTKTFATATAAENWVRDYDKAAGKARVQRERAPTLQKATDDWRADAKAGVALARGRKKFKAGTLHDYDNILEADLLPVYGHVPLDELGERLDGLVAELQRRGLAPSTVRNKLMPLRAIYRHALRLKWVTVNPTIGLEVPTGSGQRMRLVPAGEIRKYLMALPVKDRALWAVAFYAGLRRGELMALRWRDVDLAAGFITVDDEAGSYDPRTRTTAGPKSQSGARKVPICAELREFLLEHRGRAGARPNGLVFARAALAGHCRHGAEQLPFNDSTTGTRASKAFIAAGMGPVTLHDGRHTFASLMIAAMAAKGVFNPKLLQKIMGHSSIQVTYDRYGKLFPGQEGEVGVMLDDFLGADAAGPQVAQTWSRLQQAVENAEPEQVRPVVTQALTFLSSWQETHPHERALLSPDVSVQFGRDRAAQVQRTTERQEP